MRTMLEVQRLKKLTKHSADGSTSFVPVSQLVLNLPKKFGQTVLRLIIC